MAPRRIAHDTHRSIWALACGFSGSLVNAAVDYGRGVTCFAASRRKMTGLLKKAFDEASRLPEREQDELAKLVLEEIASEESWSQAFGRTSDRLGALADEAIEEYDGGKTSPLDPDKL
jgi:hypothetical protein